MINWLTHHTKHRFISELRSILQNHPRYAEDVKNVVNKFSYNERSSRGIIINSTSAERVRLSADNYVGRQHSFIVMSPYRNSKATSVEFVNENMPVLESLDPYRNVFPSPPGFYLLTVESLPDDGNRIPGIFHLTKYLSVEESDIIVFNDSHDYVAQLSHLNVYPNSVRLYLNNKIRLIPNVDYTVDYVNSEIRFLKDTPTGYSVTARYVYGFGLDQKYEYHRNSYLTEPIPGSVIAFGDRAQINDKIVIRVYDKRSPVAEVYGGKFQVTLDLLTYSKDASDREQLVDYVTTSILERQLQLIDGGLELMEVSPGTDGEESFNPETDEYYYEQSISVQLRVDWMVMVPLMLDNVDIEMSSLAEDQAKGHLDGTYRYDLLNAVELGQLTAVSSFAGKNVGLVRIV